MDFQIGDIIVDGFTRDGKHAPYGWTSGKEFEGEVITPGSRYLTVKILKARNKDVLGFTYEVEAKYFVKAKQTLIKLK